MTSRTGRDKPRDGRVSGLSWQLLSLFFYYSSVLLGDGTQRPRVPGILILRFVSRLRQRSC
ncbi:hypothetical protein I7I48_06948 [Histoplasma ohiense]|nr:hypothetical protein I7I48_06948 [Histoplasma ohiense (nom. inval.)]